MKTATDWQLDVTVQSHLNPDGDSHLQAASLRITQPPTDEQVCFAGVGHMQSA